jgi:hypothetical protein
MKELLKRLLKVFGHALTGAVLERLDHVDHALDLVIDQNNRMARTQTALLQSSIHQVNTLNRLQTDLAAMRRSMEQLAEKSDLMKAAADRALADVGELNQLAGQQLELLQPGDVSSADE